VTLVARQEARADNGGKRVVAVLSLLRKQRS